MTPEQKAEQANQAQDAAFEGYWMDTEQVDTDVPRWLTPLLWTSLAAGFVLLAACIWLLILGSVFVSECR